MACRKRVAGIFQFIFPTQGDKHMQAGREAVLVIFRRSALVYRSCVRNATRDFFGCILCEKVKTHRLKIEIYVRVSCEVVADEFTVRGVDVGETVRQNLIKVDAISLHNMNK